MGGRDGVTRVPPAAELPLDAADTNGNMTVDFGFVPNMSIGSTVFYDPNNHGTQDIANPLEDGIAGVTVVVRIVEYR